MTVSKLVKPAYNAESVRERQFMATMTLMASQARRTKAKPYNKKQAINAFVKKFKHEFDMRDDSIDLREMSKNFNDGPIPVEDIHQAIVTVLGPQYHNIT